MWSNRVGSGFISSSSGCVPRPEVLHHLLSFLLWFPRELNPPPVSGSCGSLSGVQSSNCVDGCVAAVVSGWWIKNNVGWWTTWWCRLCLPPAFLHPLSLSVLSSLTHLLFIVALVFFPGSLSEHELQCLSLSCAKSQQLYCVSYSCSASLCISVPFVLLLHEWSLHLLQWSSES